MRNPDAPGVETPDLEIIRWEGEGGAAPADPEAGETGAPEDAPR